MREVGRPLRLAYPWLQTTRNAAMRFSTETKCLTQRDSILPRSR
jgi:hypothetical protein